MTVNGSGGTGTGGVTITPVVTANGPLVQRRSDQAQQPGAIDGPVDHDHTAGQTGVSFSGQYNTVGRRSPEQQQHGDGDYVSVHARRGTDAGAGSNRLFAAQAGGYGTVHPTAGDTFTATYTIGGVSYTQTGHF